LNFTRDDDRHTALGGARAPHASPLNLRPQMRLNWTNVVFIAAAHLLAIGGILWLVFVRTSPWTLGLALAWVALCGLAITGGYHRLFAHPTYRASRALRVVYLVFGAAAAQNSVIEWSSSHRLHHAKTDCDEDPYNIRLGFWWAHIGWVFFDSVSPPDTGNAKDLASDPFVRWQHHYYVVLAILVGGVVPLALGCLWHDPIGALLVAGFLRLVIQWHTTFTINSFAHWLGEQPYSHRTSARDSSWTALISFGEGYHNFHHRFPSDYRNGVRWYQFDPTKWFIWTLAHVRLAGDLRRTAPEEIRRARHLVRVNG
jgi:stearoyl-CoA desaturase (delta-9 desaturase)